jgi:hypothetical protein
MLMDLVEDKAKADGKDEIACDTAEGADHLIAYYQRGKFQFFCGTGYGIIDIGDYIPLSFSNGKVDVYLFVIDLRLIGSKRKDLPCFKLIAQPEE